MAKLEETYEQIEWKRVKKGDTSTLQFLILFHTISSNSFIPNKIKMAEKKLIILIILIWNEGIGEDGMEEDKKLEG